MPSQRRGRFTACILGHSSVRRLHDAIACEDHDVAHRAPDSLRVARLFSRIDIFGRSGYTVSELRHEVLAAGQQRPDLVIIWRQVGDANGRDPENALPWVAGVTSGDHSDQCLWPLFHTHATPERQLCCK